ncbi:MAG: hypothetical protein GC151_19505 [Betaproteobacteria bacterium]|nr:hypothetical protein [Betaproteobacteria bacterium]
MSDETPSRTSPVARFFRAGEIETTDVRGMPVVVRLGPDDASRAAVAGICDLSAFARAGLKGPGAADWLRAQALPVPDTPNSWEPLEGGGRVLRLALSEFLIEDGPRGDAAARLSARLCAGIPQVYPVPRQDAAFALTGTRIGELLAQTCNVDLPGALAGTRSVVLTQMVSVSVSVLRDDNGGLPCYRLWCDYTMGAYLWETLAEIAAETGGGPVGTASVLREGGLG